MLNRIEHVMHAIGREPGTPVARGELAVDRRFATDFLNWRVNGVVADELPDTDLLIACCRHLELDLVCVPSREPAGLNKILSPGPTNIRRFADEGLFVFWVVDGAFQAAMAERGMMDLMTAIGQSPVEMGSELIQRSRQALTVMAQGIAGGAHGIIIADDIAYGKSTYMSPSFIEQFLMPIWMAQTKAAHLHGIPVFFHSDGNLNVALPYIAAAGFDGLQCIEPGAGMEIGKIKKRYGKELCLMGNINPMLLSDPVTKADSETVDMNLRKAVTDVMAAVDGQGGLIFGTCSGLHSGMRPEHVHSMYRLATELDPTVKATTS